MIQKEENSNNSKPKVVLVRSCSLDFDVRSIKIINALRDGGYSCLLISWERECKKAANANTKNKDYEQNSLRLKAPYGFLGVPFLFFWWFFVFIQLIRIKWDVAHAINFDCVIPVLIAAKLKKKSVVYEILDVFEDQADFPKWLRKFILSIDKAFMRCASAVIIVDEEEIKEIEGIPNDNIVIIYDSPYQTFTRDDFDISNKNYRTFTLFYAGMLNSKRRLNIENVVDAIKDVDDVKLIIAGYGDLVPWIKEMTRFLPNKIQFIGKLPYEEVIKKGREVDAFFVLRDSAIMLHKYICGSNLFNAMACGKPIIVNKGTSTAKKVLKNKCGLIVDAKHIEEIKNAIITLKKDKKLCKELGLNGRKAYENKYGWQIMKNKLLNLYYKILNGK